MLSFKAFWWRKKGCYLFFSFCAENFCGYLASEWK